MKLAQQLRERNIAEYLIYMWQVEDLLRANECNIDRIENTILSQYDKKEKSEAYQWYKNLIDMMREEGVVEKGHLQINNNVIIQLTDLHKQLLSSPKFPFYSAAYFKALPYIIELRNKNGNKEESEIETCFEALYGIFLLRLQKKTISEETLKAIDAISSFLSLLANYYDKEKKGELKFEE